MTAGSGGVVALPSGGFAPWWRWALWWLISLGIRGAVGVRRAGAPVASEPTSQHASPWHPRLRSLRSVGRLPARYSESCRAVPTQQAQSYATDSALRQGTDSRNRQPHGRGLTEDTPQADNACVQSQSADLGPATAIGSLPCVFQPANAAQCPSARGVPQGHPARSIARAYRTDGRCAFLGGSPDGR
jgi:hypothetical protein